MGSQKQCLAKGMVGTSKKIDRAAMGIAKEYYRCSPTISPWSFQVKSDHFACGISAYGQLQAYERFTATIKLSYPNGHLVRALIDTEADRTCMSSKWFNFLRKNYSASPSSPSKIRLTGANGVPLPVHGIASLSIPLTPQIAVDTEIIICDHLSHDIIIGLDALLATRAIIDLHGQSVMFQSPDPSIQPQYAYFATTAPNRNYLSLTKDVIVKPRQQCMLEVTLSEPLEHISMIEPNRAFIDQTLLTVSNGIIAPETTTSTLKILVMNSTTVPVSICKATRLATLQRITNIPIGIGALQVSKESTSFEWKKVPTDISLPITEKVNKQRGKTLPMKLAAFTIPFDASLSFKQRKRLKKLLSKSLDIFSQDPYNPTCMTGVPPVHIDTGHAKPQRTTAYRRHPIAHRYINDKVQEMLKSGLVEPSTSSWSFPVVLASKPNGKIRFCVDYRNLNTVMIPDAYSLPRLDNIFDFFHGKSVFSSLDAAAGFHQIPLHSTAKSKTAFTTRAGLYQWTRLPFGWVNAPAVFQRTMDFILRGLTFDCALVYMDDIIVFSSNFEEHLNHLEQVFSRLRRYKCQLNPEKCHFAFRTLEYLGHVISEKGVHTKPKLVEAINNFPSPQSQPSEKTARTAVKSFVALANFYRRFIPNFSLIARPLLSLTSRKQSFQWTDRHTKAMATLKGPISSATVLTFPQWSKPFILTTDASQIGIGAVLEQKDEKDTYRTVQFISHAFQKEEELPFSRQAFIRAQHRDPFCRIWLQALSERGQDANTTRGFLASLTPSELEPHEKCQQFYRSKRRQLLWRHVVLNEILWFITDTATYRRALPAERMQAIRPVVPHELRLPILKHFHIPGHRRVAKTERNVSELFYWPNLHHDVSLYVASCHACNSRNAREYTRGLLHSSPATSATHRMSLDIIGPRPISPEGYRYILVMVNHYTKWVTAVPLCERNCSEVMKALEDNWLSEGYACQQTFADRAPELWKAEFKALLERYGSTFIPGPPHHSETQGHVERANRTIQDAIAKKLQGSEHQWYYFLKPVVQAYRHTVHEATGYTPFYLMHGWEPLPPSLNALLPNGIPVSLQGYVDSLKSNIEDSWKRASQNLRVYHDRATRKLNKQRKVFRVPIGSYVYVRIPPGKGQSQGFQSFNSGLWKLLSYDSKSNKCRVITRAQQSVREEDVHSQYVFPFTGSLEFTPKKDYPEAEEDLNKNRSIPSPTSTILKARPYQQLPRRRGRPSKTLRHP